MPLSPKPLADSAAQKTPRKDPRKDGPHPVDIHVGQRLRELRMLKGLGQSQIAKLIGITFQQIQKYERGTNRISASRLYDISETLGVPISYFYDKIPPETSSTNPSLNAVKW